MQPFVRIHRNLYRPLSITYKDVGQISYSPFAFCSLVGSSAFRLSLVFVLCNLVGSIAIFNIFFLRTPFEWASGAAKAGHLGHVNSKRAASDRVVMWM